ncbi:MAG: TetR/AcrR family transcriptional regulator [Anaerolineae bacterium]|jgi:AcrR family transcriptional regulator
MMDAPDKREQAREERRRQILEAALAVFVDKGYHAANVSDVAAAAGVSQGTIYWYFASKEELFNAAILAAFEAFGTGALAALEEHETAEGQLWALVQSMEQLFEWAEGLLMLFLSYWASSSNREEASRLYADLLEEYKDVVVGIVQRGVDSGEFQPVDAEGLVWAVLAAYDGLAAYTLMKPDLEWRQISYTFLETIIRGLKTGDGGAQA